MTPFSQVDIPFVAQLDSFYCYSTIKPHISSFLLGIRKDMIKRLKQGKRKTKKKHLFKVLLGGLWEIRTLDLFRVKEAL